MLQVGGGARLDAGHRPGMGTDRCVSDSSVTDTIATDTISPPPRAGSAPWGGRRHLDGLGLRLASSPADDRLTSTGSHACGAVGPPPGGPAGLLLLSISPSPEGDRSHPRFPGANKWVAPSARSADLSAGWGYNALKSGRKGGFFWGFGYVAHYGATPVSEYS